MRTTLNLPDLVVREAKRRAIEEATTMTDLIVEGLKSRLEKGRHDEVLPVSTKGGGLLPGVTWDMLEAAEDSGEAYR